MTRIPNPERVPSEDWARLFSHMDALIFGRAWNVVLLAPTLGGPLEWMQL